jgi:hypothetical protein
VTIASAALAADTGSAEPYSLAWCFACGQQALALYFGVTTTARGLRTSKLNEPKEPPVRNERHEALEGCPKPGVEGNVWTFSGKAELLSRFQAQS